MGSDTIEVAITLDDLPYHGPLTHDTTRLLIHQQLAAAFVRHKAPACGFVIGKDAASSPDNIAALNAWHMAGLGFGNHTYSHMRPRELGAHAYMSDIAQGASALEALYPDALTAPNRFFRFPYLDHGFDRPSALLLRRFLIKHEYRVAGCTISYMDWEWNQAYVAAANRGDDAAASRVLRSYIPAATANLRWAHETALQLCGRAVKHVVVMHAGVLEAITMDTLLAAYKAAGARFISLDEALTDPIYPIDTNPGAYYPRNVMHDLARERGKLLPSMMPRHAEKWLRSIVANA